MSDSILDIASLLCNILYLTSVTLYTCHIWLYFIIIKRSGDVEKTLDLRFVHMIFLKLSLLCAYIVANQCDTLSLWNFLDSGILSDDVNLDITG